MLKENIFKVNFLFILLRIIHVFLGGTSFFNRFLFDKRPMFDGLFFGGNSLLFNTRKPRQIRRPLRPIRDPRGPVYPPVDPFGNTEYIPLPGRVSTIMDF